jgi:hypothetical protein
MLMQSRDTIWQSAVMVVILVAIIAAFITWAMAMDRPVEIDLLGVVG